MRRVLVPLMLAAGIQLPLPPPQPPIPARDAGAGPTTGTALIRGRVTDRESGQPIPRAVVVAIASGGLRSPDGGPPEARTGSDGRYELKGLPAGEYSVVVRPADFRVTHLLQAFGEDRPSIAAMMGGAGRRFTLADGEVRDNVDVALWRAMAIEGRVVDEFGEPMAGISVWARTAASGQRPPMSGPYDFSSDDRGQFRIYGLAPGRYTVCANPRNPIAAASGNVREAPIQTCYPAAVIESDAQEVTVATGDVGGIEIRVQRSRTFTASGMALDSSGAPLQRGEVMVMRLERSGSSGAGIEVRPNGEFVARGLIPGDYAVQARVPSFGEREDKREPEMAWVPFRIDASDVEGLMAVTRKAARVRGRVIFEDAIVPPGADSLQILAVPDRDGPRMMGPQPNARVNPDMTFELGGLFGPAAILVSRLPRNWIVKTVRYKAQDITDLPIDFAGARPEDTVDVVLFQRGARIAGRAIDEEGHSAEGVGVVLLPADPARWKGPSAARFARMKEGGAFELGPVRPGEYLIAAIGTDDAQMMQMRMAPETGDFERLARVAQRITLVEDDRQTIDVRVTRLR